MPRPFASLARVSTKNGILIKLCPRVLSAPRAWRNLSWRHRMDNSSTLFFSCSNPDCKQPNPQPKKNFTCGRKQCKSCVAARNKEWRKLNDKELKEKDAQEYWQDIEKSRRLNRESYQRRKEKIIAQKKAAYAKNREAERDKARKRYRLNREARLAQKKDYHAKNKKQQNEKSKQYYAGHKAESRAYKVEWRKANPHKVRASAARRRKFVKGVPNSYTGEQFEKLLERYKHRCHWCGKKIVGSPHADHLIPLAKGGSNEISNIVPSCARCNLQKQAKMPWEFAGRLL
jgi:hypothetical protein